MTVNVRIRTLKAFFNWCFKNGHTKTNLADGIKLQKVDNDRIMAFTLEQVQKLLSIPDQKTYAGFRDYVLMMCLLDTGLRCQELLSLTVDDVNFHELTLTVPWDKAKTRKTRTVPISKKVAKLLAELIQEIKILGQMQTRYFTLLTVTK
jgi:integrase/recombinase XerD